MLRDYLPAHIQKDFIISFFFLIFLYGITHNSYMYPEPKPVPGNWSIQKLQHPLFFGLAGHNYIVLKDQTGTIVSELHGLATDPVTGLWKYIGTEPTDLLRVWEFDETRYYLAEKSFPGVIVAEGDKDTITSKWTAGLACKEKINQQYIPYPPYGFRITDETENSNSVAYTLALCMGADVRHIGFITPGARSNLLEGN